jgi:cysteinyl-tRNA synthetase
MALKIFNTLTQKKEIFEPVNPGKVGMYVCGPTVYKPSHIGHAVGPIIFDAIKRYLQYKNYDVTWVVNITDVEDKLIAEAEKQGLGMYELAEKVTAKYLDAMKALNVTGIDHLPKASEHIGDIIDMCQRLIEKDLAYAADGDVYFDVSKDEDYGKLSHRKVDDQQSTGRELAGGQKRNAADFALWKKAKEEEPEQVKFDSPWGKGRPGWHIECSVMSTRYLGETFDIHGGGLDLVFPHHENEIAQSESCYEKPFAKYWMHNGLTRFNTKKISKSDAEMAKMMEELVLDNLLQKYSGELLRFFVLSTHYRRPIDFSDEEMAARKKGLESFYRLFERAERITGNDPYAGGPTLDKLHAKAESDRQKQFLNDVLDQQMRFLEAMDDDFNTAGAIAALFEAAPLINRFMDQENLGASQNQASQELAAGAVQTLRSLGMLLGLFETPPKREGGADDQTVDKLMQILVDVRAEARKSKQFALADMVRDQLAEAGITLEDRPEGTIWRRGE